MIAIQKVVQTGLIAALCLLVLPVVASAAESGPGAPGVTSDTIKVGQIGPQTGPVAVYDGIRKGIQAYFNYVNENGGVDGRQLDLIAYDDQYQPAKAVRLIRRLVEEDKVFAILGEVGTPSNTAIRDYVVDKGIPTIMPCAGGQKFVDPPVSNWLGSCNVSYQLEARVLVNFAVKDLGARTIAIAYDNDDYGTPLAKAAREAIKDYDGVEVVKVVNFLPGDRDLSTQALKIKRADPDAVINFATVATAALLKKAMYAVGYQKPDYIVPEVGGAELRLFSLAGDDVWDGSWSTLFIPMPNTVDTEKMATFVREFKRYFPDTSLGAAPQVGWAEAQVFVEALRRTDDLTWDNFLKAFYTFDDWKGSLYVGVSFSPQNHYGLTSMFMSHAEHGKIVPASHIITIDPITKKITYTDEKVPGVQ